MSVFDLPKPAWMAEDHEMLAEQAGRFFSTEVAPRYDEFESAGVFDRDIWTQAGEENAENRVPLKKEGFLTRDPRMVERKKYGQKKARKKFKFSKR